MMLLDLKNAQDLLAPFVYVCMYVCMCVCMSCLCGGNLVSLMMLLDLKNAQDLLDLLYVCMCVCVYVCKYDTLIMSVCCNLAS